MTEPHPISGPAQGLFDSERMQGVMSFNLRLEGDEGDRAWAKRLPLCMDIINQYNPLFVGTQEGKHGQLEQLQAALPDYAYLGVSRRGNTEDEYSALFYDKTRMKVKSHGDFWLSDTPDVPASTLPGSGHPRMVTWGEFLVEGAAKPTFVFNTHTAEQPELSAKQIAVLLEQAQIIAPADAKVVITGDFNINRSEQAIARFSAAGFADAFALAGQRGGPDFSFHNWKGEETTSAREVQERSGKVLDWIFYRNGRERTPPSESLLMNIVAKHDGGVYPSDHFPVVLTSLGRTQTHTQNLPLNAAEPVMPDTPITVIANLHNRGTRGMAPATLRVDDENKATTWHVLNAGETRKVQFEQRLYEAGEHAASINDAPAQKLHILHKPATLEALDLSAPDYLTPGEDATIQTSLRNTGSVSGATSVNLMVDDEVVASQQVELNAGELRDVEFTHRFKTAGAYKINIGGREAEISVAKPLVGEWLFRKGDGADYAAPAFADADWQKVKLPAPWEQHSDYTEDNVYGWYRTKVFVPQEWKGRPVRVLLGKIDDVDESFFNGSKIGQNGRMPDDAAGYKSAALTTRAYTIAPQDLHYGEENTIAIRVFDALGDGGMVHGPLGILPLKAREASKWTDKIHKASGLGSNGTGFESLR